jgi:16S rRNA (guanine527-N7)-methyltransferase
MLTQHLVDCLAAVPALARHAGARRLNLLDAGSGGGVPGLVFAVMLPQLQVTCADAVAKKAAFVRQAAATLGVGNVRAVHARVEALPAATYDLVVARAFSSLAGLVRLTRRQLAAGGTWIAMKGKRPADEIGALPADVTVFHVEPLTVPGLRAERCLVYLRPSARAGADGPGG